VLLGDFVVLDDELGEVLLDEELPDAPLAPEPDLLK